ncbi:hypothetical protein G9A89_018104 [Geosiphon pyriformis]|nr:hypothetical protein G9A89_018104 [Geosiphon pyriformis]
MAEFMSKQVFLRIESANSLGLPVLSVLDSETFFDVHNSLIKVWSNSIEVYTDGSLKGTCFVEVISSVAAYFPATNMDIKIRVHRLLSSTLAELQAIVLALKADIKKTGLVKNSGMVLGLS